MTLHRLFLPKRPSRPPPRATVADLTAYPRRAIDRICRRIRHSLVYAWPPAGLLKRPIPPPYTTTIFGRSYSNINGGSAGNVTVPHPSSPAVG